MVMAKRCCIVFHGLHVLTYASGLPSLGLIKQTKQIPQLHFFLFLVFFYFYFYFLHPAAAASRGESSNLPSNLSNHACFFSQGRRGGCLQPPLISSRPRSAL